MTSHATTLGVTRLKNDKNPKSDSASEQRHHSQQSKPNAPNDDHDDNQHTTAMTSTPAAAAFTQDVKWSLGDTPQVPQAQPSHGVTLQAMWNHLSDD